MFGSGRGLRRRQNGGQGASKAFGAVKKGVKTAQWAQLKTEKLTVPPARSSIWCQQWVCTPSVNSRGCLVAERRDFLVNFFFELDPEGGSLTRKGGGSLTRKGGGPDRAPEKPMGFP